MVYSGVSLFVAIFTAAMMCGQSFQQSNQGKVYLTEQS